MYLEIRSPKGGGGKGGGGGSSSGGSSSGSGSGSKGKGNGSGIGGGASSTNNTHWLLRYPIWARVLIVYAMVVGAIFVLAFIYYLIKALRNRSKGKPFSFWKVLWHATRAATGLWLPIWIWKSCCGRKNRKTKSLPSGTTSSSTIITPGSGAYTKIENQNNHQQSGLTPPAQSWYGGAVPAYTPPPPAADVKYEPMGYTPYTSQTQQGQHPVVQATYVPSPVGTPAPMPMPSPAPQGGAAASYYGPGPGTGYAPYSPHH